MSEERLKIKCCGEPAKIDREILIKGEEGQPDIKGVGVWCEKWENCGNKQFHKDEDIAIEMFKSASVATSPPKAQPKIKPAEKPKKETKPMNQNQNNQVAVVNRQGVMDLFQDQTHLMKIVSPIIDRNNGAMERLIENNLRYVQNLSGPGYDKLWETEQGRLSIIRETEEAFIMGLEMGKAGSVVPFGDNCKFIPEVDGVIFALTFGNNAPFKWVNIDTEYEGDIVQAGRKTGNYFVDFESFGEKRTVLRKVHVYGLSTKTGLIDGETYDAIRLLEKAYEHSDPYKNYVKKMNAFEYAKTEGKVKKDANGREFFTFFTIKDSANDKYFEKSVDEFRKQEAAGTLKGSGSKQYASQMLPGKNGEWEKKIYRYEIEGGMEEKTIYPDDLSNPYAGPDQPEMLRKTAGKSFLTKFLKVRNSEAAMSEVRTNESVRDQALKMADDVIPGNAEEV